MKSLLTNSSALAAIQTLNAAQRDLDVTQTRIATGLRVASSADHPGHWSVAEAMRSDASALSTVKDALGLGAAMLDIVTASLNGAVDVIDKIKAKLAAARQPGVDRARIQAEIAQLQSQMQGNARSAAFNGDNWLVRDAASPNHATETNIVSFFSRAGASVEIDMISVDLTTTKLYDLGDSSGVMDKSRTVGGFSGSAATLDISGLTDTPADLQKLDDMIALVDVTAADVRQSVANYGETRRRLSTQDAFIGDMMSSMARSVGALVDADMSGESTRLQALQTQMQLGAQSLSIANTTHQFMLKIISE